VLNAVVKFSKDLKYAYDTFAVMDVTIMDKQKLDYFRNLLLTQRREAEQALRVNAATGRADADGVIDIGEVSEFDLEKSTALDLAGRESDLISEIDDALQRIEDGTYGQCRRCGKPIDEARLKAMPTARYDAQCQTAIEAAQGLETPTL
jgi:DnaK suppressor protein